MTGVTATYDLREFPARLWKMVRNEKDEQFRDVTIRPFVELYELVGDPLETRNLALGVADAEVGPNEAAVRRSSSAANANANADAAAVAARVTELKLVRQRLRSNAGNEVWTSLR